MVMEYKEIEGDLIELAKTGVFDVIAHGVNCQGVQGGGIAASMVKAFKTNDPKYFPLEDPEFNGDMRKLGSIDFCEAVRQTDDKGTIKVIIINAYTQYNYGKNHIDGDEIPLSYEALTLCMKKINYVFKGKHIGLPAIGSGLAGGDWTRVQEIIKRELKDCEVTVVIYKK